jgi:6-phosphofructokinase 1
MRLLISTGGGDAPGLNAVIYAAVHAAERLGIEIYGVRDSYDGILYPDRYAGKGVIKLDTEIVRGIAIEGGTFLGTTNRGNPFVHVVKETNGGRTVSNRSADVIRAIRDLDISALISVGGDGSLTIAHQLSQQGLRVIGVPKTIDNDLAATDYTFGFQTAVSFATECIERLHATAEAHCRVLCVEVMGRHAGWIALHAGVAAMADAILIPEIPFTLTNLAAELRQKKVQHAVVVIAEGAAPMEDPAAGPDRDAGKRFEGIGQLVASGLEELLGIETRTVTLGHLLRGGSPVPLDRLLGFGFGVAAVQAAADGLGDIMVALDGAKITHVPLADAIAQLKQVPADGMAVQVARALGICLGDTSAAAPTARSAA